MAQEVGTPFYLYDKAVIRRQWEALHENKPAQLRVFYAVKGNPTLAILRIFRALGAGVEIASGGELFLALKAGFSPEDIIFTGPAKTDAELEFAVQTGIRTIHLESLREAERLHLICTRLEKRQAVLVRINSSMEVKTQVQLSGCPSPFGISEEDVEDILPAILQLSKLDFKGIHVYNASGILDYRLLLKNVEHVFELVTSLEKTLEIDIPVIDFGGGLGVDYSDRDQHVDVPSFYRGFDALMHEYGFQNRHFILEIARYLMASSGSYITKVLDKKMSRGTLFLITDGGIHHFMRKALFDSNHSAEVLQSTISYQKETVHVTGCLCTSIDRLLTEVALPKASIGDYIRIKKAGCYSLSAAINHFLSHEMPAEILLEGKDWKIIRSRGKHGDLLINQP